MSQQNKIRRLAMLAGGVMLAVTLGAPVAAQASAQAPAQASVQASVQAPLQTTSVAPDITFNGCDLMQDVNTGKYASNQPDSLWLYFVTGTTQAIQYCALSVYDASGFTGRIEIADSTNGGRCLGINTSNGDIGEASISACGSPPEWDQWVPIYVGDSSGKHVWVFKNYYQPNGTAVCIYDYKQEPAIYTGCNTSNTYEQFRWNAISP